MLSLLQLLAFLDSLQSTLRTSGFNETSVAEVMQAMQVVIFIVFAVFFFSYAMLPHHFYRGDLVAEAALLIIGCYGDFYSRKLPQSRCLRVLYKRVLV